MRRHLQQVNHKVRSKLGINLESGVHGGEQESLEISNDDTLEVNDESFKVITNVCRKWKEEDVDLISINTMGEDEETANEMRDLNNNDSRFRSSAAFASTTSPSKRESSKEEGKGDIEDGGKSPSKRDSWFDMTDHSDLEDLGQQSKDTEKPYTIGEVSSIHSNHGFCPISTSSEVPDVNKEGSKGVSNGKSPIKPIYIRGETSTHSGSSPEMDDQSEKLDLSATSGAFKKVSSRDNSESEVFLPNVEPDKSGLKSDCLDISQLPDTFAKYFDNDVLAKNARLASKLSHDQFKTAVTTQTQNCATINVPTVPHSPRDRSPVRRQKSHNGDVVFQNVETTTDGDGVLDSEDTSYARLTSRKCSELYEQTRGQMGTTRQRVVHTRTTNILHKGTDSRSVYSRSSATSPLTSLPTSPPTLPHHQHSTPQPSTYSTPHIPYYQPSSSLPSPTTPLHHRATPLRHHSLPNSPLQGHQGHHQHQTQVQLNLLIPPSSQTHTAVPKQPTQPIAETGRLLKGSNPAGVSNPGVTSPPQNVVQPFAWQTPPAGRAVTVGDKGRLRLSIETSNQNPPEQNEVRYVSTRDIHNSYGAGNLKMYKSIHDMINLWGPLTEDNVIKTIQARYYDKQYYTWIGPVLVSLNPNTVDLDHCHGYKIDRKCCYLRRLVEDLFKYRLEKSQVATSPVVLDESRDIQDAHAHTIVLTGAPSSGKTFTSLLLMQHLFDVAGGLPVPGSSASGTQTDSYKHLQAIFCVLRSLTCAATKDNTHSSQMGFYTQSYISDGTIYKTKVHAHFIDQSRIIQPPTDEQNYNIFYEMLAGISSTDRARYFLDGLSIHNLWYLGGGDLCTQQNSLQDRERFNVWKSSLAVLGIPLGDVLRILAAILLLGNVQFMDGNGLELDIQGENELRSVSKLLGVTMASLTAGFTTLTRRAKGQTYRSFSNPHTANEIRNTLSKALYMRTVSAIIKRANSSKPRPSTSNSTISSDGSTDSNNDVLKTGHTSFSITRPGSDWVVGILDMPGFSNKQCNHLEQLHRNLCVERIHQHYITRVFKDPIRYCHDNGIQHESDVSYTDNCDVISLIAHPQTGLLSLLDLSCLENEQTAFLQKARVHHKLNASFSDNPVKSSPSTECFSVNHFCGPVVYQSHDLHSTNQDSLPDDVINVFAKNNCSFGFVTHLFAAEFKAMSAEGAKGPVGNKYRITRGLQNEGRSDRCDTLSTDVQRRLDTIVNNIEATQTHYVHCVQATSSRTSDLFDRQLVTQQVRSLQLLEAVHIMTGGFPHKMRYRMFTHHYRLFTSHKLISATATVREQTKAILDAFLSQSDTAPLPTLTTHWAFGKNYIFLSEFARQSFEQLRDIKLHQSATRIQATWRGFVCAKKWPMFKKQNHHRSSVQTRGRTTVKRAVNNEKPQPRSSSWTPMVSTSRHPMHTNLTQHDKQVANHVAALKQTCSIYGLDMDQPPPVPSRRGYSVQGGVKVSFPQLRVMRMDYQGLGIGKGPLLLRRGEDIKVVALSTKPGHVIVEHSRQIIHVPGNYTQLKTATIPQRLRVSSTSAVL